MVLTVKIKKKLKNFILDVDFSTEAGCMGILGASGSGKSMTLKCIAGIETPDEGIIILDDQVLFDSEKGINLKPQERRVGYLFQSYALFPNMTVAENLAIGWKTRHPSAGINEVTAQVSEMIQRFHLSGLEKQYPNNLSGGEQQRTAMARMLLSEPEVLLFDEPFSALDTYLKEELQAELRKTMQEFNGISILVTHSRDEVYKLSDTLLVMEDGRGLQHGNTKEMFHNPKTFITARLTGCKNISPIAVVSEGVILAEKWNLPIHVEHENNCFKGQTESETCSFQDIYSQYRYVGIRAHDFWIYNEEIAEANQAENVIKIKIQEITEAPFEWNVMFTVETESKNEEKSTDSLWWKISKELVSSRDVIEVIRMLRIKPEGILFLK